MRQYLRLTGICDACRCALLGRWMNGRTRSLRIVRVVVLRQVVVLMQVVVLEGGACRWGMQMGADGCVQMGHAGGCMHMGQDLGKSCCMEVVYAYGARLAEVETLDVVQLSADAEVRTSVCWVSRAAQACTTVDCIEHVHKSCALQDTERGLDCCRAVSRTRGLLTDSQALYH